MQATVRNNPDRVRTGLLVKTAQINKAIPPSAAITPLQQ